MLCRRCGSEAVPLLTGLACDHCDSGREYSVGWVVWRNSPVPLPVAMRIYPTREMADDANTNIRPGAVIPCGTHMAITKSRFAAAFMTRSDAEASGDPAAFWVDDVER